MSLILREHMELLAKDETLQPTASEIVGFIHEELVRRKTTAAAETSHAIEKFRRLNKLSLPALMEALVGEQPFDLWLLDTAARGNTRTWAKCHQTQLERLFGVQETSNFIRANNTLCRELEGNKKIMGLAKEELVTNVRSVGSGRNRRLAAFHVEFPYEFFAYAQENLHQFSRRAIVYTLAMADLQKIA
jgi:hypothetical protein